MQNTDFKQQLDLTMKEGSYIASGVIVRQNGVEAVDYIMSKYKSEEYRSFLLVMLLVAVENKRLDLLRALDGPDYLRDASSLGLLMNSAIRSRDLDIVKYVYSKTVGVKMGDQVVDLIAKSAFPKPKEPRIDGGALLTQAIALGDIEIAKFLLEKGIRASIQDKIKNAVGSQDLDMVNLVNEGGKYSALVMHFAAILGNVEAFKFAIDGNQDARYGSYFREAMYYGSMNILSLIREKVKNSNSEDAIQGIWMGQEQKDLALSKGQFHTVDFVERNGGEHVVGKNPEHDAYKNREDELLKNVNPLVYNVNLKAIESYREFAERNIVYKLFAKQGAFGLPPELFSVMEKKLYDQQSPIMFDAETALKLNFPTPEEIEKVAVTGSPQAKSWIALLEKNQIPEVQKG